ESRRLVPSAQSAVMSEETLQALEEEGAAGHAGRSRGGGAEEAAVAEESRRRCLRGCRGGAALDGSSALGGGPRAPRGGLLPVPLRGGEEAFRRARTLGLQLLDLRLRGVEGLLEQDRALHGEIERVRLRARSLGDHRVGFRVLGAGTDLLELVDELRECL